MRRIRKERTINLKDNKKEPEKLHKIIVICKVVLKETDFKQVTLRKIREYFRNIQDLSDVSISTIRRILIERFYYLFKKSSMINQLWISLITKEDF